MKFKFIAVFVLAFALLSCKGGKSEGVAGDRTNVTVKIVTNKGDITLKLYDETPGHRDNFLKLVDSKVYEGSVFHRVIQDFMIQGGDPATRKDAKDKFEEYKIPAEIVSGLFHKKGALAAARQADFVNPKKESSGNQFYIVQGEVYTDEALSEIEQYRQLTNPDFKFTDEVRNVYKTIGGTPFLDADYTVFGEVVKGLDVVDKIAVVETTNDVPNETIVIKKVEIVK